MLNPQILESSFNAPTSRHIGRKSSHGFPPQNMDVSSENKVVTSQKFPSICNPLAGLSHEQIKVLAREKLAEIRIADLNLRELERLALDRYFFLDVSRIKLRELKELAKNALYQKQVSISSLPKEELHKLANERIKSRGAAAEPAGPAQTKISPTSSQIPLTAIGNTARSPSPSSSLRRSESTFKIYSPRPPSSSANSLPEKAQQPTEDVSIHKHATEVNWNA